MLSPKERASKVSEDFRAELVKGNRPNLTEMITQAIEDFREKLRDVNPCIDHPTFKGVRKPRTNCEACWRYYLWRKDST